MSVEKTELLEDLGSIRQDEARIEWKFDTPEVRRLSTIITILSSAIHERTWIRLENALFIIG